MSGKYTTIMIFICACALNVIAPSHASHPRETPRVRTNPNNRIEEGQNEIKRLRDGGESVERERDRNAVRSAPETILSVQYDRGVIKELYVSQRQGGSKEASEWRPTVSEKAQICEDLCSAGLGGDPCGYSCQDSTPLSVKETSSKLRTTPRAPGQEGPGKEDGLDERDTDIGYPRSDVCPTLCEYALGKPLCGCRQTVFTQGETSWSSICEAFCTSSTGSYRLKGCPACEKNSETRTFDARLTTEVWIQYCKVQCKKGSGGAACNCDKIPFSVPITK